MIRYNLNLFRTLLQDLSNLTNTVITFFDENFNSGSAHSSVPSVKKLCDAVKCHHTQECSLSDKQAFDRLNSQNGSFYYTCHFGLIEMAFRISFNGDNYGYIIAGPFRDPQRTKEDVEHIRKFCETEKIDPEKMIQDYKRIEKFSLEKFHSFENIFISLLEYAKINNIIYDKSDLFSQKIETYIDEHLTEPLTIELLCKEFFLTQKQLYSIFRTNANTTPKRYVAKKRVEKARHLLITTDYPLPEIASMVGVEDYNYFIKIFKQQTGFTPMHYRKKK